MSVTCKHCDCDNFREELMGNAMMVSNEGNCKNCQHPVNAHPRASSQSHTAQPIANVVHAAAISESGSSIHKGHLVSAQTEQFISSQNNQNPLNSSHIHLQEQEQKPVSPLRSVPLDHSGAHIAQYDPSSGGYVPGTGTVMNNECTQGNYNHNGLTGPGVNGTVQSSGSVAYGGSYGAQYEGGYYSAKRIPQVSSSAPVAQEVKIVSSSSSHSTIGSNSTAGSSGEFDYDSVRAQYGNGYSAKR